MCLALASSSFRSNAIIYNVFSMSGLWRTCPLNLWPTSMQVSRQGLPVQNGVTHFDAGDSRAQEVTSFLKTNDPAGFTIVDVLAWGALGHAVGFFILATINNGYNPQF